MISSLSLINKFNSRITKLFIEWLWYNIDKVSFYVKNFPDYKIKINSLIEDKTPKT